MVAYRNLKIEELLADKNMPKAVGVGRVGIVLEDVQSADIAGIVDMSKNADVRRGTIVMVGENDGLMEVSQHIKVGAVCVTSSNTSKQMLRLENGLDFCVVYHADISMFFDVI